MPGFEPIRQDEYPATDELQCIAVHIPAGDEYKILLAGFIAMLTSTSSYEDPESAQADGIAATFDEGYAQTNWDGCGIPPECQQMNTNIILFPSSAFVSSGNAITYIPFANMELGGYWQQNPALTADQFRWQQYLAAGNWDYTVTYRRATGNGKGNFYVTSNFSTYLENVNFDLRGTALDIAKFTGSFTVPGDGGQYYIGLDGTGTSSGSTFIRPIQRVELYRSS